MKTFVWLQIIRDFEINVTGHVHLFDVRREDKPVWTLSAHSDGVNGLVLSPQCPDCLVTVSSDETMKVMRF